MNLLVQLEDKGANCMQNDRVLIPRRHPRPYFEQIVDLERVCPRRFARLARGHRRTLRLGRVHLFSCKTQQPPILYQVNNKCLIKFYLFLYKICLQCMCNKLRICFYFFPDPWRFRTVLNLIKP